MNASSLYMQSLLFQYAGRSGLSLKELVLYLLTALFFITLYLPGMPVINNAAIGLLCLFCFFYNSLSQKAQLLRARPAITLMLLFGLLHTISVFLSHNRQEGITLLQLRAPLLLFPLSLGLILVSPQLKSRLLWLFPMITTGAAIACFVYALAQFLQTGNVGLLYNDSLTVAIGKQSVYFALLINLAIFSYVYQLFTQHGPLRGKGWIYAAIFFLVIIQFMLASRMEISFMLVTSCLFFSYYFFVRRRKTGWGILFLAGLLTAVISLIVFFPKTINRFREIAYPRYTFTSQAIESHYNGQLTPDQWNGMNIRLAIWTCGWELSKEHPVFGVSVGDKQDALMAKYKEKGFEFGIRTQKNMHSNYLDLLASMGITGLLFFLAGYIFLPLISCYKNKDVPGALFITALAVSLITETYIDRSTGCTVLAFFIAFVIACHQPVNSSATGYRPDTV